MSDTLVTPWSGSTLRPRPEPARALSALAAPTAGGTATRAGWSLLTPWSGTTVVVRPVPAVRALPTLAPTLPAPRPAADEVLPALV